MSLVGELDGSMVALLHRSVAYATHPIEQIDLRGVTFIDTLGVRALVSIRRRYPEISIVGANEAALRVMRLVGAIDVFAPTSSTEPAARVGQGAR
jgi:anti-anti-sigma factor